jgi:hypothetical protein
VLDAKTIDGWLSSYPKAWQSDALNDIAELFETDARGVPDGAHVSDRAEAGTP